MSLTPSQDLLEIATRQQETTEARQFLEQSGALEFGPEQDFRELLQRALLGGLLRGIELYAVRELARAARYDRSVLARQERMPMLARIAGDIPDVSQLERDITSAISPAGEVLDHASPVLGRLRTEARQAQNRLNEVMERNLRRLQRQELVQEPLITQRNGRMVLLIKTEMRSRVPGIVHDVSDSGATVFVEPMQAIDLGNRWREARLAQERGRRAGAAAAFRSRGRKRRRPVVDTGPGSPPGPEHGQGPLLGRPQGSPPVAGVPRDAGTESETGTGATPPAARKGGPGDGGTRHGSRGDADHRPQRRRQDGGPEDGGAFGDNGPCGSARPGRRSPSPLLRWRLRRHRRPTEHPAVAVDLQFPHDQPHIDNEPGHCPVPCFGRRVGRQHRSRRRGRPWPARSCAISGTKAFSWWPPPTIEVWPERPRNNPVWSMPVSTWIPVPWSPPTI